MIKQVLDPKNPIHWNFLVYLFALAHFGKWPGRGRPLEWKGERYTQLQRDFDRIRNEKPTIASIEVCGVLKERDTLIDIVSLPQTRLDKEVKRAYDPRFNPDIAAFIWVMLKAFEQSASKTWSSVGSEVEAETMKEITRRSTEAKGKSENIAGRCSN